MNLSPALRLLLATLALETTTSQGYNLRRRKAPADKHNNDRELFSLPDLNDVVDQASPTSEPTSGSCPCFDLGNVPPLGPNDKCLLDDSIGFMAIQYGYGFYLSIDGYSNTCSSDGLAIRNLSFQQISHCRDILGDVCSGYVPPTTPPTGKPTTPPTTTPDTSCDINDPILPDDVHLPLINDIPCAKYSDLNLPTAVSFVEGAMENISIFGNSESVQTTYNAMRVSIKKMIELFAGKRAEDNVCFGNFPGTHFANAVKASLIKDPTVTDFCHKLPLNKESEYSIISGAFTIPPGTCGNEDEKQATFCLAVSYCPETELPTVAFNVNDQTISCIAHYNVPIAGQAAAAFSNVGSFDGGAGISLTNQFHVPLILYTGVDNWDDKLITYQMKANYYNRIDVSFDPFQVTGNTQSKVLAYSIRGTRAVGIEGLSLDNIEKIFDSSNDVIDTALELIENVSTGGSIQAGMTGDLLLAYDFSKLDNPFLKKLLPKSKTYQLAGANLFFQTKETSRTVSTIKGSAKTTKDIVIRPGVYAFAGIGAIQNVIYGLFEYTMSFVASIVKLIDPTFNWEELTQQVINENFDAGEDDSFGFGMSVTDKGVGFILNLPFASGDIGSFKAECKFEYDGNELSCSTQTDFQQLFWNTVWREVEGRALFVVEEATEFFTPTGKIIAAGFETTTDIFSEENLAATAKDIVNNVEDTSESIADWAITTTISTVGQNYEDGTYCLGGTSCRLCKNPETWWYGNGQDGYRCGVQPKWEDKTYCLLGTSCSTCQNPATWWYGDGLDGYRCGAQPKFADKTYCFWGTSCNTCQNAATWWYGDGLDGYRCGDQPKWADGTVCLLGTSCNVCQNTATFWPSKVVTACGTDPTSVEDVVTDVVDTVGDGLDTVGDAVGDGLDTVGDAIGVPSCVWPFC